MWKVGWAIPLTFRRFIEGVVSCHDNSNKMVGEWRKDYNCQIQKAINFWAVKQRSSF